MDRHCKQICGAFDVETREDRRKLCSYCAAKAISPDQHTRTMTNVLEGERLQLDLLERRDNLDLRRHWVASSGGQNSNGLRGYEEEQMKASRWCTCLRSRSWLDLSVRLFLELLPQRGHQLHGLVLPCRHSSVLTEDVMLKVLHCLQCLVKFTKLCLLYDTVHPRAGEAAKTVVWEHGYAPNILAGNQRELFC